MKSNKTIKKFRLNHPRSVRNFYKITDNKCGHPGRIFYANADDDIYFVIKFSSKKRKDRKLMKHSIDSLSNKDQYVCKNPSQVGFDDMSYVEKYKAYRIHPDDYQLINEIEKKYFAKKKNDTCESPIGISVRCVIAIILIENKSFVKINICKFIF